MNANQCQHCKDDGSMLSMIHRAGLTQIQLAELLKVSSETLRLWSIGRSQPRLKESLQAAKILNCTVEQFAKACKIDL